MTDCTECGLRDDDWFLCRKERCLHRVGSGLVDKLIVAALDVLHHDRTEGSDVDRYEREQLRKKFTEALKG